MQAWTRLSCSPAGSHGQDLSASRWSFRSQVVWGEQKEQKITCLLELSFLPSSSACRLLSLQYLLPFSLHLFLILFLLLVLLFFFIILTDKKLEKQPQQQHQQKSRTTLPAPRPRGPHPPPHPASVPPLLHGALALLILWNLRQLRQEGRAQQARNRNKLSIHTCLHQPL